MLKWAKENWEGCLGVFFMLLPLLVVFGLLYSKGGIEACLFVGGASAAFCGSIWLGTKLCSDWYNYKSIMRSRKKGTSKWIGQR